MSAVQTYYLISSVNKATLDRMGIDFSMSVREGDKSLKDIENIVKSDPTFCRDEESISVKHLVTSINSNNVLYATLDETVAGVLLFMFNTEDGRKIIYFDGICSPSRYSGTGVGQALINTLIKIGKTNDIKYIKLECKGKIMNYYRNKFGFKVFNERRSYDSDNSDDEDAEPYYDMILDLSTVTGGKKNKIENRRKNKTSKKNMKISKKRRTTRRKLRK